MFFAGRRLRRLLLHLTLTIDRRVSNRCRVFRRDDDPEAHRPLWPERASPDLIEVDLVVEELPIGSDDIGLGLEEQRARGAWRLVPVLLFDDRPQGALQEDWLLDRV